jgi:hypothetical protein
MRRIAKCLGITTLVFYPATHLNGQNSICSTFFDKGIYDEHSTYTSLQSFQYAQATICSDRSMTREQASTHTFGSGGNYLGIISGFMDAGDSNQSFEYQRDKFCSMNLNSSTASDVVLSKSKTISKELMDTAKIVCAPEEGFHPLITPSPALDSFAINLHYITQGESTIRVNSVQTSSEDVHCGSFPRDFLAGDSILCTKPPEKLYSSR